MYVTHFSVQTTDDDMEGFLSSAAAGLRNLDGIFSEALDADTLPALADAPSDAPSTQADAALTNAEAPSASADLPSVPIQDCPSVSLDKVYFINFFLSLIVVPEVCEWLCRWYVADFAHAIFFFSFVRLLLCRRRRNLRHRLFLRRPQLLPPCQRHLRWALNHRRLPLSLPLSPPLMSRWFGDRRW